MQSKPWYPFRHADDFFRRGTSYLRPGPPGIREGNGNSEQQWPPSANIIESSKEYLIKAELPGVEKSAIKVSIDDGQLIIEGEHENDDETEHRPVIFFGSFFRSFILPTNVDTSRITSKYKNGILRVHLPKAAQSKPEKATTIRVD
ncbi:MAG TPA: Hsp20/alpha crystallin family protein [Woeseiaceae bacterium]|nr:Hsp20/alpha crystallin family protein [Woeseiaceae bacterium]